LVCATTAIFIVTVKDIQLYKNFDQHTKNSKTDGKVILYFDPKYLSIHTYSNLVHFQTEEFDCHFNVKKNIAKSIDFSPFGGISILSETDYAGFKHFFHHVIDKLKAIGTDKIVIIQPPFFYPNFLLSDWLIKCGFQIIGEEKLQYIDLQNSIQLHDMQKRKLKQSAGFEIRKVELDEISEIHDFIAQCRKYNGLEINISKEKLLALFEAFPDNYEAFLLKINGKLASAVIMTRPTSKVCYYYLPATDAEFKSQSPMVHLLNHLTNHYQTLGFNFMDLGISSIDGNLQTSLADFKKRMGAQMTDRILFELTI
jgi:hypothetical protein